MTRPRTAGVACLLLGLASPRLGFSQSLTTEVSATAGVSSEQNVSAAATQVRAFGELPAGIRLYGEAAWAATTDTNIDAFGTAYPYRNRIQLMEAYGEHLFRPGGAVAGVKAGRYRTPFGISSASDQGYIGFLRPPLMRYDNYWSISNNFLEHGVDAIVGVPRLTLEATLGVPSDTGSVARRSGLDTVLRMQGYAGPLVAGASFIHTLPYQSTFFAHGHAEFYGIDWRLSGNGIEFRGEFIDGHPFSGTKTIGWYTDLLVHHAGMGPITALARLEDLSYQTSPPFDMHATRQTAGVRIRVLEPLALQVNLLHQTGAPSVYGTTAVDIGLTYSLRRH